MNKQLFYKDIFDILGNRIPVLTENGSPIIHTGTTTTVRPEVFEQYFDNGLRDEPEYTVDITIYGARMVCFPTYYLVEIASNLYGKAVNAKTSEDNNFVQTYSSNEGIIWLKVEKPIKSVTIEFNSIVRVVNNITQC